MFLLSVLVNLLASCQSCKPTWDSLCRQKNWHCSSVCRCISAITVPLRAWKQKTDLNLTLFHVKQKVNIYSKCKWLFQVTQTTCQTSCYSCSIHKCFSSRFRFFQSRSPRTLECCALAASDHLEEDYWQKWQAIQSWAMRSIWRLHISPQIKYALSLAFYSVWS